MQRPIRIESSLDQFATHFEARFARVEEKASIVGTQLSTMGSAGLLSIGVALAIALAIVSQELDVFVRTILAAFGGILVIAAMMWKALL